MDRADIPASDGDAVLALEAFRAFPDCAVYEFDRANVCRAATLGDGFVPCGAPDPIGRGHAEALPDGTGTVAEAIAAAFEGKTTTCGLRPDEGRVLRVRMSPRATADGAITGAMAVIRDVSALDHTDELVRGTAQHFRLLVELGSDLVATHDEDGRFRTSSASAERLFGWPPTKLIGRSLVELAHPDDAGVVRSALQDAARAGGQVVTFTYRLQTGDGPWTWAETTFRSVAPAPGGAELHSSTRDVSDRKALEDSLRHRADHDPLTGAVSRSRFEHDLDRTLRHSRGTAGLALLDLDEFKRINDTLGHAAGDDVLRAVTVSVQQHLRPGDIVCRWGGDEFALLIHRAEEHDLHAVTDRVLDAIRSLEIPTAGTTVAISASAGVALLTGAHRVDDALAAADHALYAAKHAGRDGLVVADSARS